jgi:hypothetical protein
MLFDAADSLTEQAHPQPADLVSPTTARVARQSGPDQLDRSGVLLAGETLHHVVASLMTILIPKPRGQAKSALSSPPRYRWTSGGTPTSVGLTTSRSS